MTAPRSKNPANQHVGYSSLYAVILHEIAKNFMTEDVQSLRTMTLLNKLTYTSLRANMAEMLTPWKDPKIQHPQTKEFYNSTAYYPSTAYFVFEFHFYYGNGRWLEKNLEKISLEQLLAKADESSDDEPEVKAINNVRENKSDKKDGLPSKENRELARERAWNTYARMSYSLTRGLYFYYVSHKKGTDAKSNEYQACFDLFPKSKYTAIIGLVSLVSTEKLEPRPFNLVLNVMKNKGAKFSRALWKAAGYQQPSIIQSLLKFNPDPNRDHHDPHLDYCHPLKSMTTFPVPDAARSELDPHCERVPLGVAILLNRTDNAKLLLEQKADPVETFIQACTTENELAIQFLLEQKIDPNAMFLMPFTRVPFLPIKSVVEKGNLLITRRLLEFKANPDQGIYAACAMGHEQLVDLLLEHKADPNRIGEHDEYGDVFPLRAAASKGHARIMSRLIEAKAELDRHSKNGLISACQAGHVDAVTLLLDAKVVPDNDDKSLFLTEAFDQVVESKHYAETREKQFQIVKLLVDAKADVNQRRLLRRNYWDQFYDDMKDSLDDHPLFKGVYYQHLPTIKLLAPLVPKDILSAAFNFLNYLKKDRSIQPSPGARPYHMLPIEGLRMLLENRPDPLPSAFHLLKFVMENGKTEEELAAYLHLILVEFQMDINDTDKNGIHTILSLLLSEVGHFDHHYIGWDLLIELGAKNSFEFTFSNWPIIRAEIGAKIKNKDHTMLFVRTAAREIELEEKIKRIEGVIGRLGEILKTKQAALQAALYEDLALGVETQLPNKIAAIRIQIQKLKHQLQETHMALKKFKESPGLELEKKAEDEIALVAGLQQFMTHLKEHLTDLQTRQTDKFFADAKNQGDVTTLYNGIIGLEDNISVSCIPKLTQLIQSYAEALLKNNNQLYLTGRNSHEKRITRGLIDLLQLSQLNNSDEITPNLIAKIARVVFHQSHGMFF